MEKQPENKQESYQELTEPSIAAAVEYVDAAPEIDDKKREMLKSRLLKFGSFAITAAASYGAYKSGALDSIPIADDGELAIIPASLLNGYLATKAIDLVETFRKK